MAAGLLATIGVGTAAACTNFIITKGASTDGSAMVSYAADSHQLYGALYKYDAPRKGYRPGTMMPVYEWDTGRYLGDIPQAAHTYSTVGNMNDRQLIIAETTYGVRNWQTPMAASTTVRSSTSRSSGLLRRGRPSPPSWSWPIRTVTPPAANRSR